MKISIITLFPNMVKTFFDESIIKRAQEKGSVEIEIINLRDFAIDKHGTVDDRPYGGGAGMVLRPEPLAAAIRKAKESDNKRENASTLLTSPKGTTYTQKKALELAELDHLIIVCGHYEGVDERIRDDVDEEISIGDYVLTGGEIPAAAIVDSIVRLQPGVLKKEKATIEESFFEVPLKEIIDLVGPTEVLLALEDKHVTTVQMLEYPHYTRPEEFEGKVIPEILTHGNHEAIRRWRIQEAYNQTVEKRPDLLKK